MVEIVVRVDKREYAEALAARDGRTWRQIFLSALNVAETPGRKPGRPPRRVSRR